MQHARYEPHYCLGISMDHVSFNISDNWDEHPELRRQVNWRTSSGAERYIMFEAAVGTARWTIRLNNYPDELCFSVLIDGSEVMHFDNWPERWGARPSFPTREV